MNNTNERLQTPIDTVSSGDNLEFIKAVIPYMSPGPQKFMAVYIKLMELNNLMHYFHNRPPAELSIMSVTENKSSPESMLHDLEKYSRGPFRENLNFVLTALDALNLLKSETPSEKEEEFGK